MAQDQVWEGDKDLVAAKTAPFQYPIQPFSLPPYIPCMSIPLMCVRKHQPSHRSSSSAWLCSVRVLFTTAIRQLELAWNTCSTMLQDGTVSNNCLINWQDSLDSAWPVCWSPFAVCANPSNLCNAGWGLGSSLDCRSQSQAQSMFQAGLPLPKITLFHPTLPPSSAAPLCYAQARRNLSSMCADPVLLGQHMSL